jgi:hypothetical protein
MVARGRIAAAVAVLWTTLLTSGCPEPRPEAERKAREVAGKGVAAAKVKENPGRVKDIQERCAATPEEGKEAIAKVQDWVPVVNDNPGGEPLKDVVATYKARGIYDLCWAASKKSNGRWKVVFNYVDVSGGFQEAEWEYDPATGEVKTFSNNADTFWTPKA